MCYLKVTKTCDNVIKGLIFVVETKQTSNRKLVPLMASDRACHRGLVARKRSHWLLRTGADVHRYLSRYHVPELVELLSTNHAMPRLNRPKQLLMLILVKQRHLMLRVRATAATLNRRLWKGTILSSEMRWDDIGDNKFKFTTKPDQTHDCFIKSDPPL